MIKCANWIEYLRLIIKLDLDYDVHHSESWTLTIVLYVMFEPRIDIFYTLVKYVTCQFKNTCLIEVMHLN